MLTTEGDERPINDLTPEGRLLDWVLLGPFRSDPLQEPLPDGVSRSGFHQDFLHSLGGEPDVVLTAATAVTYATASGQVRTATAQRVGPAFEPGDQPEFHHILPNRHILERDYDEAVAYAFCYLRSDCDQEVTAYLGSDGSPKAWLNGKLVHWLWKDRRQTVPWQDAFRLNLRAGSNRLLLKIDNRRGWWGFQLDVYTDQHHLPAVRRRVDRLAISAVAQTGNLLSVSVVPQPRPLGVSLPVAVALRDTQGTLIAEASGTTAAPVRVALPSAAAGKVCIRAVAEDRIETEGANWSHLRHAEVRFFVSQRAGPVAEDGIASRAMALLDRVGAHAAGAPDAAAGGPTDALVPVRAGVLTWLARALATELDPIDPWAVRLLDFGEAFAEAVEDGQDFLADHPLETYPIGFERVDAAGIHHTGKYLLSLPPGFAAETARFPLLIHLHGSSTTVKKIGFGDPNVPYFDSAPFVRVSPMAPYPLRGSAWDIGFLNAVLADVLERLPIDADRVYLQGGSGGGKGTWDWATANPEHFAAISVLCGGDGYPFRAARLKHVPSWVFNGELDLASYPFLPELMVNALRRVKGDVTYTLFPNLAHAISAGIDKDAWLSWYLRQQRSSMPVPRDPLDLMELDDHGISPIQVVDVPAATALTLTRREHPRYPQDNVYRSAMKLYQAYRKPEGTKPVRQADGIILLREVLPPAHGAPEGKVTLLLSAPDLGPLAGGGLLGRVQLPAMTAARACVTSHRSEANDSDWDALALKKRVLYDRIKACGLNRTGEERTALLTVMDHVGRRYWEVFVGVEPGHVAKRGGQL